MAAKVRLSCGLTQLQCTDVGHNAPAVARLNLLRIVWHCAEARSHYLEEITEWSFSQSLGVIRRRVLKATLNNHSIAIAKPRMAGRAINIKTLSAALQNFVRNRKRH